MKKGYYIKYNVKNWMRTELNIQYEADTTISSLEFNDTTWDE